MCGRYSMIETKELAKHYDVAKDIDKQLKPNYNAAPGQYLPIVIRVDSKNVVKLALWGLIPKWAKDPRIGYSLINAKAETLGEKPTWRNLYKSQRCLVPASGFFEWQKLPAGKVPFYFHDRKRKFFAMAGLYEILTDPSGHETLSFTIITTAANKLIAKVHERMPVVLAANEEPLWLDAKISDSAKLDPLLDPYDAGLMRAHRVSDEVNKTTNNRADLIYPLSP